MRMLVVMTLLGGVTGCCPSERPPPFDDCPGGCEAALLVSRSAEPDGPPEAICEGFPTSRAPRCPAGLGVGWELGVAGERATWSPGPIFEGYQLEVEAETESAGHGRLCFFWVSDVGASAANNCGSDWECASGGTITFTAGGGARIHALFTGGATVDLTLAAPRTP